ncbi:MAG: hypothetical protein ACR2HP_07280, partial [Ilumatobacteraceae bacterium]
MATRERSDAEAEVVGAPIRCLEAVGHDLGHVGRGEDPELDEVGLGVERLVLLGEDGPHHRRFRSREDQAERLVLRLQMRAQDASRAVDPADAGELVEHQERRRLAGQPGDDLQLSMDGEQRIRSAARWSATPTATSAWSNRVLHTVGNWYCSTVSTIVVLRAAGGGRPTCPCCPTARSGRKAPRPPPRLFSTP